MLQLLEGTLRHYALELLKTRPSKRQSHLRPYLGEDPNQQKI